jgi:hypothetical protein
LTLVGCQLIAHECVEEIVFSGLDLVENLTIFEQALFEFFCLGFRERAEKKRRAGPLIESPLLRKVIVQVPSTLQ